MNIRSPLIFLLLILVGWKTHAMVFDNRYFPLIQEPYITIPDRPNHVRLDGFVTTGNQANGNRNGVFIGIPELFGTFDLGALARAFSYENLPNPLSPTLTAADLPYTLEGKIQTQGLSFSFYHDIRYKVGFGFYIMAMQSNSSLNFLYKGGANVILSPSDIAALGTSLRQMVSTLGLTCDHVHQIGFGDIDAYLRYADRWEYLFKFRSIQAGARLGVLIPTGQRKNIYQPASVPFGGNGFWGFYGAVEAEFEVREDWKAGLYVRVSKRIPQTHTERLPALQEQPLFGTIVEPVLVNPGWTGVFLPYVCWENLRQGLGLRGQYTLIAHEQDSWKPKGQIPISAQNIEFIDKRSYWASEYVTLTGFYDFGKMKRERCHEPIILLSWYIPVSLLVAKQAVRSYKVSIGVEYSF